ncbi:hypothetical protein Bca4012_043787 [Brassica carinata]
MKSVILFIASCVVLLLILSYPIEGKADSNRCHVRNMLPGKCGNDGIQSCLRDFKKMNKKSHVFDQCSKCNNHKSPSGLVRRDCNCSFPSSSPCV